MADPLKPAQIEALRGERVLRLAANDRFVFGRGAEECDALRAAGLAVEVSGGRPGEAGWGPTDVTIRA